MPTQPLECAGVRVTQQPDLTFTVTYGKHVRHGLTFHGACHEFGEYVFHSWQCQGLVIDNTGAL